MNQRLLSSENWFINIPSESFRQLCGNSHSKGENLGKTIFCNNDKHCLEMSSMSCCFSENVSWENNFPSVRFLFSLHHRYDPFKTHLHHKARFLLAKSRRLHKILVLKILFRWFLVWKANKNMKKHSFLSQLTAKKLKRRSKQQKLKRESLKSFHTRQFFSLLWEEITALLHERSYQ